VRCSRATHMTECHGASKKSPCSGLSRSPCPCRAPSTSQGRSISPSQKGGTGCIPADWPRSRTAIDTGGMVGNEGSLELETQSFIGVA
jgi:hypothetical protein